MDKVRWTPQMELGIPEMDAAHKALIDSLAELIELPDEQFGARLMSFIATLEQDFRGEEAAMDAIDFPAMKSHAEQHARVLGTLHHVVSGMMQGEYEPARRAVALVPQWFILHLATQDAALAAAMELAGQPR